MDGTPTFIWSSLTTVAAVRMRGDDGAYFAGSALIFCCTRSSERAFCDLKAVYALIACISGWTPKIRIARFKL